MGRDKISDQINSFRRDFNDAPLTKDSLSRNPFEQFEEWMSDAIEASLLDPNAMCLATVDKKGGADTRIVYLREITEEGFVFYTNYESVKCQQLFNNSKVSLNFLWNEIGRQVKIKGEASKANKKMSDDYFSARPRQSQLGAWASKQSAVIENRSALERQLKEVVERFEGVDVPRPEFWGGILVKPTYFEFWKGRASRFHDRYVFEKEGNDWSINTLSP